MKFTESINKLDQALSEVLDGKAYGLATRVIEFNGRDSTASSGVRNPLKADEIIPVTIDDRYQVIWHHRLDNIIPRREKTGAYGNQEFGIKYEYNIISVFAVRSDYKGFLFEDILGILSNYTTLIDANFESSVVYRQEYEAAEDRDSPFPKFSLFSVRSYMLIIDGSDSNECC